MLLLNECLTLIWGSGPKSESDILRKTASISFLMLQLSDCNTRICVLGNLNPDLRPRGVAVLHASLHYYSLQL